MLSSSKFFILEELASVICILSKFFNVKFCFCFAAVLLKFCFCFAAVLLLLNFSTEDALLSEIYLLLELFCLVE